MIKSTMVCDISGKQIETKDYFKTTVCSVHFKEWGKVSGFKGEVVECVVSDETYEFHISAEKSKKFMQGIQKLMKELKE